MRGKSRDEAGLLDVLVDGFEKSEIMDGWHRRDLPMPDEDSARRKLAELVDEATRWKGAPSRTTREAGRQLAGWGDLEVLQAGRGVMVRARAPWFDDCGMTQRRGPATRWGPSMHGLQKRATN